MNDTQEMPDEEQGQEGAPRAGSTYRGGAHAVRWGMRYDSVHRTVWTKWHWTEHAFRTLCGRRVRLISDRWPNLPDTDERREKVNCRQCRRAMKGAS